MEYENANELENDEELIMTAMNIILHAGNARTLAEEAYEFAKVEKLDLSEQKMAEAEEELVKAHQSQTKVIQDEARGITHRPSLLFNHAQDHLMTIMVEIKMTKKMVELAAILLKRNKIGG